MLFAREVRLTTVSCGSGFGHMFAFTAPESNCIAFRRGKNGAVAVGGDGRDAVCRIRASDAGFVLEKTVDRPELSIRVNAREVDGAMILREGDTIQVGPAVFRFETSVVADPSLRWRDLSEEQGMARLYEALKAAARGLGVSREAGRHHRTGAMRR